MTYSIDSHITSMEDVRTFFHHLVEDRSLNFHPDDDFSDYICLKTHEPSFTPEEVTLYNRLMDESFTVCGAAGQDIYSIGLTELYAAEGIGVEQQ